MRLIVTNYSSAVDMGVMLGRVAICFKAGQEDYGKQCTRGVRHMKWYLPQLLWPGTQEVAWRLTGGGGQCLQGASRHTSTPPARDGRTAFGVEKGGICPALELPGWSCQAGPWESLVSLEVVHHPPLLVGQGHL